MSTLVRTLLPIAFIFVIAYAVYPSREVIVQPIAYNHNVHIEGQGLECSDCHIHFETKPAATLPGIDVCADCHSGEPESDSPEEVKLLKYIENEQQVPWQRIYEVPDHVYFSHRRHVVLGELDCAECHGNVAAQTKPVPNAVLAVTMENCMDCHERHKVSNDCLACHR